MSNPARRNPSVAIINNHVTTTSAAVAEFFGKRHADVLRAIEKLECSPEYHQRNFALMTVEVAIGKGATRKDKAYRITKDGFVFLAMGFTGKEAAQWKEAYISAFNAMEEEIIQKAVKQAALPVVSQIDRDKTNRINKRSWNLAQAAYEDYRTRMMEDPLVKNGSTKPEEWQPIEASKDVLELIRATATTLAAASRAINRRGDSLARMVGED